MNDTEKKAYSVVRRDPKRVYLLTKDGDGWIRVYSRQAKNDGQGTRLEARLALTMEDGFLYFVDALGDISRMPLSVRLPYHPPTQSAMDLASA